MCRKEAPLDEIANSSGHLRQVQVAGTVEPGQT